jgi:hypothetical protein
MPREHWLIAVAFAGVLVLAACGSPMNASPIVGSGVIRTEVRELGGFSELHVENAIRATVSIGQPQTVRVTADDNVLAAVTAELRGSRLELRIDRSVRNAAPVLVDIVVPSLHGVRAGSAGQAHVAGLDADALEVAAESGGVVVVAGQAERCVVRAQSAGNVDLADMRAASAEVQLEAGARARLQAATVTGRVTTGSVLSVVGEAEMDVETDAAGIVVHEE